MFLKEEKKKERKREYLPKLQKYPEMGKQLVGGFFFLRFVCPFLVTPTTVTLTPSGRRRMILVSFFFSSSSPLFSLVAFVQNSIHFINKVSKVIQNLSNGLLFGEKETYMVPLNSLLDKLFIPSPPPSFISPILIISSATDSSQLSTRF